MEEKKFTPKLIGLDIRNMEAGPPPADVAPRIEVQYILNVETRVSEEKKFIIHLPTLTILDRLDQSRQLGSLTIAVTFEIENFNEAAKKREDGNFDIDENLDKKLTIIALHTLRGVAYTIFRTTYLSNIVLPIFEADTLVRSKRQ